MSPVLTNVEFLKGEIENIPLPDRSVDVSISNCVINLSGDKDRVRPLLDTGARRRRTGSCTMNVAPAGASHFRSDRGRP